MSGSRLPPADAGLQAERTTIAWERTGLTVIVNGLVFLRFGDGFTPLFKAVGIALVVLGLIVGWVGRRRGDAILGDGRPAAAEKVLVALACATALMVVCTVAAIAL